MKLSHSSGMLSRIDRVTASSLGRPINRNYCENIAITAGGREHMLQIASLYFQAKPWEAKDMAEVMLDVAKTSLRVMQSDLDT